MVSDVDTLTMRPRKFIAQLYIIASILYSTDKQRRPKAYEESIYTEDNIVKVISDISKQSIKPKLVTTSTKK